MSEAIYLLQPNGDLVRMDQTPYDSEDVLQELLATHPHLLAGEHLGSEPRRWLLIDREAALPGEEDGGGRWAVDHLFLDQDATPTLVEVKRASDTRIRREVVGQILDYAANAVAYWPSNRLREIFERRCSTAALDAEAEVTAVLGPDADAEEFWEQAGVNLKAGRMRLVFVADVVPAELRRVVEFLNEQMNPAEVIAIEVRHYQGQGLRTLVPRVIGQTAVAVARRHRSETRQWDEASFFAELTTQRGPEIAATARELLEWAGGRGWRFTWGRGIKYGSFIPALDHNGTAYFPLALYTTGIARIQFTWLTAPFEDLSARREFLNRLNQIPGVKLGEDVVIRGQPAIDLSILAASRAALEAFKATLEWFSDTVQAD